MRSVWRNGQWIVVEPGLQPRSRPAGPMIMRDLPAYKSPLGTGVIEGRAARREDLARGGCREVDPGEFRPRYLNPKNAHLNESK